MHYRLVKQSGCCGNGALWSVNNSTPTIGDTVYSHSSCQGDDLTVNMIITEYDGEHITCTVTDIEVNPGNYFLDKFIRHKSGAYIPIDDDDDDDEYTHYRNVYVRNGKLYNKADSPEDMSYDDLRRVYHHNMQEQYPVGMKITYNV